MGEQGRTNFLRASSSVVAVLCHAVIAHNEGYGTGFSSVQLFHNRLERDVHLVQLLVHKLGVGSVGMTNVVDP